MGISANCLISPEDKNLLFLISTVDTLKKLDWIKKYKAIVTIRHNSKTCSNNLRGLLIVLVRRTTGTHSTPVTAKIRYVQSLQIISDKSTLSKVGI
jgi:hypothetical protein